MSKILRNVSKIVKEKNLKEIIKNKKESPKVPTIGPQTQQISETNNNLLSLSPSTTVSLNKSSFRINSLQTKKLIMILEKKKSRLNIFPFDELNNNQILYPFIALFLTNSMFINMIFAFMSLAKFFSSKGSIYKFYLARRIFLGKNSSIIIELHSGYLKTFKAGDLHLCLPEDKNILLFKKDLKYPSYGMFLDTLSIEMKGGRISRKLSLNHFILYSPYSLHTSEVFLIPMDCEIFDKELFISVLNSWKIDNFGRLPSNIKVEKTSNYINLGKSNSENTFYHK
jgi:hypothetical protein